MAADAQRTIELVFEATDKTAAAVQSVIKNTDQFASNIQSATQPIADFTLSALKFEAALLATGVAVTAFSVKVAADFDTAFREIATLIELPIDQLGEFRQAILDYASSSTKPLEEITQSIYNAISAGVDYSESIDAVAVAEKLAVAGKATLNDSLLVLVSSLNAYGLGMDDAERFSNALFTTVKQGQTTLPELASSLASVTGLAATAGVSFEELLAAIATLTSTGTPTSQAITQIQGAISAILKPSSQAKALAAELGIEFNAERLAAVGLSGVLADVAEATGGNSSQMALLFGRVEALNGVLTLTGLGADKFAENLQAMAASAGTVDAAFAIMVQSVDVAAQKINNALTGLFITIGAPLLDEFSGVAEAIAEIFRSIAESAKSGDGGIADLIAFIESQFQGLQETLQAVARNLPAALEGADFSGFINGVKVVTEAVSNLFGGLDLTSVEGLTSAIELVGLAFESLSQFSAGVIDSLKPLFSQITTIGGGLSDLNPELFRAAGDMAGFATQANYFSGVVKDLTPALSWLVGLIGLNQTTGLVGGLYSASKALSGSTGLLAFLGKAGLIGVAGAAGAAVGTIADKTTELVTGNTIGGWATDFLEWTGLLDTDAERLAASLEKIRLERLAEGSEEATAGLQNVVGAAERVNEQLDKGPEYIYNFTTGMFEAASESEKLTSTLYDLTDINEKSNWTFESQVGTLYDLSDAVGGAGDSYNKFGDTLDDTAKKAAEASKEIEKISIEEKLALIEAQSAITVAQIDADAKTTVAAFESISETVKSTGDAITDLYGLLGDADISKLDKLGIQEQIQLENERRDEALRLQRALVEAEIRSANARAEAFRRGTAAITVDGAGLQPQLEAFMFEILRAIQVKVNAQGYEFLLGAA